MLLSIESDAVFQRFYPKKCKVLLWDMKDVKIRDENGKNGEKNDGFE